jgi:Soluble NSF attachment protein, SNAP
MEGKTGNDVYSKKAEEFISLATKKMQGTHLILEKKNLNYSKGGFMDKLFGNKAERAEEACELFKQAATNYKLAKKCK